MKSNTLSIHKERLMREAEWDDEIIDGHNRFVDAVVEAAERGYED